MKKVLFILLFVLTIPKAHFAQFEAVKDSMFLYPTKHINSDHPEIVAKALELTANLKNDVEKVKAIYEFVRDSHNENDCKSYIASEVLEQGGNSCIRRSILMTALCRAVGIPARLHNQVVTIKDFQLFDNFYDEYSFLHGLAGIKYNDKWFLFEPVGNRAKWNIWNDGKDMGNEGKLLFKENENILFPQTDKITLKTVPVYFADYDELYRDYKDKMYSAEIGLFE